MIACLGKAVAASKSVQGYRKGRRQLVIFEDVDVLTYAEVEMDGNMFPLAYVLRSANRKTWLEIHEEIRNLQADPEQSPNARRRHSVDWFLLLPTFARDIFYRFVHSRPHIWKQQAGTVYLTSLGMFGEGRAWGMGYLSHSLGVIVGGISQRPVVRNGQIEIRDCMNITLEFDHDIIDGAPAARFAENFKKLVESGDRSILEEKMP
jgi:pyruvate/2-oxoglutarate dehydrogenase complex dihydrolipoamide acyltransferase (E2) component